MTFKNARCTIVQGSGCDTDHCLVAANVGEKLAVNKQESQKFDVEICNVRKLNELEVRKRYQIKISNRSSASENLNEGRTKIGIGTTLKRVSQRVLLPPGRFG
jgi:hypothetical protein